MQEFSGRRSSTCDDVYATDEMHDADDENISISDIIVELETLPSNIIVPAILSVKTPLIEPELPAVSLRRVLSLDPGKNHIYALAALFSAINGAVMPCFSIIFSRMVFIFYTESDAGLTQNTLYFMGVFFGKCL